ncbi:adenylate kinase family protein [Halobacterium sp. R2-5]|uniref:adenylate kinase family protein n=1 Tax=Halobacterium sp. R2-5 TaxID=2715751 RepID=UPI00141E90D5|nr:adenylate kinase family protein [Halobacterium sp. R2-5]NIB99419.1 AAA family ATPase [Halobacterium sp. R2-5]
MRVAVTGTPGTGKTTAVERLDANMDVVHLNDVIGEEGLYTEVDEARDSKVADLDAIRDWLDGRDDVLVESHLAHHLDADRVVVLRCAPGELERRLVERGEPAAKAEENAESEALDVVLSEAVQRHGRESVYEVDATDRSPDEVADAIQAVLAGEREPSAGDVDFTEYL